MQDNFIVIHFSQTGNINDNFLILFFYKI
ncbi:hypothetical protein BO443_30036 [Burkholderia orbicola]